MPSRDIVKALSKREAAAPSESSLRALSWLNFFLSSMQTAFGPIAAAYLVLRGWTAKDIGLVLTIGGIASLAGQVPGGELVDIVRAKRLLVATGVVTVALSVLILGLWPSFALVALAEVLQGMAGSVLGSAVVAVSLGLVGHARLPERLGRNQRFAAAGAVAVTLSMAVVAYSGSHWALFVPAAFAVPALVALNHIRAAEIDFARASGAESTDAERLQRANRLALLKNRRLLIFAGSIALFQVASASMMPLLAGMLAYEGKGRAAPLLAALIIVPQLLAGLLAPRVGQWADKRGRKPLLLLGLAALPIRAALFAIVGNPLAFLLIQLLDVFTAAVLGVLTPVVIADVTKGTGRFNLAQGMFGTVMGIGASLSPMLTSLIVDHLGSSAGFMSLAGEGFVALVVLATFLPETKDMGSETGENVKSGA
jgi:MFS family permease